MAKGLCFKCRKHGHRACYKNIPCWHGPYSFSCSLSPSTSILRTTHAYTCTISSGWSSFLRTFSGYILFDCFSARLYHICSPDLRFTSPMPFPSYQYPSYYILNPLPDYWSFTIASSPLPLPYYWSLTHSLACLSLYYYLWPGLCSFSLRI